MDGERESSSLGQIIVETILRHQRDRHGDNSFETREVIEGLASASAHFCSEIMELSGRPDFDPCEVLGRRVHHETYERLSVPQFGALPGLMRALAS